MAHFAQLNENNIVTQVIVIHNNECTIDGIESEEAGIQFCKSLYGTDTNWKQTSYNANIRKNYAGIGFKYDYELDAFIPPQPFPSWILDEATCNWIAPVSYPQDELEYIWDENNLSWIVLSTNDESV
jgi:hypothetical protein